NDWFTERGAKYTIQVAMYKDIATITLDTTGSGLHTRGYRVEAVEAPIKETMAAGLVQLSFWHPERRLIDPFCGSGTILIEAAMMARNIAPGLGKKFASEQWDAVPMKVWRDAKTSAYDAIDQTPREKEFMMRGTDIDPAAVEAAKLNADTAGVAEDIIFEEKDVHDLWIDRQYGIMISNPPYGQRISDFQSLNQMYISLHKTFKKKFGWSVYVLTGDKMFPRYFKRARPDRVRKLFNGNLEVNYYQYYGDRPPKPADKE
ncbi:MAG: methyltransferase, partial [Chloroflexota bacterium]